jgi:hypothetical protein
MIAGPTMNTLLLTADEWDLCVDAMGNIAMASPPYATAQDVASAVRTFLGDAYYDQTAGIDYLGTIIGHEPTLTTLQSDIEQAALTVPGVVSAQCTISGFVGRKVTGQVAFTTTDGQTTSVPL